MDAYMYWRGENIFPPHDTPPLTQALSGWAPHLVGVSWEYDGSPKGALSRWNTGVQELREAGPERARWLVFLTRLPFLGFALATAWLIRRWAGELFGAGIGLILAVFFMLEPNTLAHGVLIKSDVAATFSLLLFCYCAWKFWLDPDRKRLVLLGAATALAVVTKFTLLLTVPAACLVVAFRYGRSRRFWEASLGVAGILLLTYLTLVVAYEFVVARTSDEVFLEIMADKQYEPWEVSVLWKLRFLPLPVHFVEGVRFMVDRNRGEGFPAYMLGRKIARCW
jgi:hypothetical protein